jgi:apolipoprotein N-acyltransferase
VVWAAAGGLAIAACFMRFSLWPLAWIAWVPILVAIRRARTTREAARVGWSAGLATNLPAFYWLVGTISGFGGFPLWLSLLFYVALSLYSSFQFVLFTLATRRAGFGPAGLFPAITWVALEFLYPKLFPWRMGNTQYPFPVLLQIGEITGPFGLSFVMLWVSTALALSIERSTASRAALIPSMGAALGVVAFGTLRLAAVDQAVASAPSVHVGIVQGNLTLEERADVRFFESNLATYRRLTEEIAPRVDVTIWPETVLGEPLPRDLEALPRGAVATLGLSGPLLTGALTYEGSPQRPRYYNSVILLDGEGRLLGTSDKQILMPFGEYMPFGSIFPVLKRLSPMTGDFQAGSTVVPLDLPNGGRFAPLNCYEDLIASIARGAVREGGAEVLFSVANDAWFGNTAAPYQHEALALWRAVENRRFLIRVTNTGVTDIIDPAGRVRLRLPVLEPATAVQEVKTLHLETIHTRFGDAFAWTVAAVAVLVFALGGTADREGG